MKKIVVLLAALVMAVSFSGTSQAAPPEKPKPVVCGNHNSSPTDPLVGHFKSVRVVKFESCYMRNSEVDLNFTAKGDVFDVVLTDTVVGKNIKVSNSLGEVRIGSPRCAYDPEFGNNIMVRNSHNVRICWMSGGNIRVFGADGRVTIRDNAVRHINVSRSREYSPNDHEVPPTHRRPGALRFINNTATGHIKAFNNPRLVIDRNNSPEVWVK